MKVACTDAGRVEILNDFEYFVQFVLCGIDSTINGKLVHDGFYAFTQESVIIQRSDQVFGYFALFVSQVLHGKLLFQYFVEGNSIRERYLFGYSFAAAVVFLQFIVGDVILGTIISQ